MNALPSELLKSDAALRAWPLFRRTTLERCRIHAIDRYRIRGQVSEVRYQSGPPALAPGGAGRDRTDGLLLAKQALSQLSYGPAFLLLPVTCYLLPVT